MEIKVTNNYELFKIKDENREINFNKVFKLKQTMIDDGRQIMPIICNVNMEIMDGQHRYMALKELGWDVMYYIDSNVTSKDLISINNTQTNWGMKDYVHYYAALGKPSYQRLENILNKYAELPTKVILSAVGARYIKEYHIKNGNLEFTDEEFENGIECLDYLIDLKNKIKMKITNQVIFFFLIVKTYYLQGIDRGLLFKNVMNRYGTENYGNSEQCAQVLEHFYNYNQRNYRYLSNEILPRR